MELDRSPIRMARLADEGTTVPAPLVSARASVLKLASDAADEAIKLAKDDRWSEPERQRQLSAVADKVIPEITKTLDVVATVNGLCDEREAQAVRDSLKQFDQDRLLLIATTLANRPKEARMSAIIRARHGDRETAAAIVNAPSSLGLLDGFDDRVIEGLRDSLIDPAVRSEIATTRFAATRCRVGIESATARLRTLTRTLEPAATRILRATA